MEKDVFERDDPSMTTDRDRVEGACLAFVAYWPVAPEQSSALRGAMSRALAAADAIAPQRTPLEAEIESLRRERDNIAERHAHTERDACKWASRAEAAEARLAWARANALEEAVQAVLRSPPEAMSWDEEQVLSAAARSIRALAKVEPAGQEAQP